MCQLESYLNFQKHMDISEEIKKMKDIGFSKSDVVDSLIKKGIALSDIENFINNFYPKVIGVDKKSISFIFTLISLTIFSLSPLIGLYLMQEYQYAFLTLLLLILTLGFYKLNLVSLIIWLVLVGLLLCYIGFFIFYKLSGSYINSLYSFSNMIAVLLFLSLIFRLLIDIYNKQRQYRKFSLDNQPNHNIRD